MLASARLGVVLALLSVTAGCTPLDDVMAAIFGRHMRDSRSFDPYENTLAPPLNSVPFAAGNITPGPGQLNTGQPERGFNAPPFTQADLFQPIVQTLPNPVAADEASLARGEELFNRMCAVCHGEAGVGAEAFIVDKFRLLMAFNLSGPVVAGYSDGYIYGIIRVGRGLMPPYAHQISHFDRWNIVNYVRVLQREAGNPPAPAGGDE